VPNPAPEPAPAARLAASRGPAALAACLLFAVVAGIYLPALSHPFITYDDPVYVSENPHVAAGLTWAGIRWALASTEASNWHPLTWLSHMADAQVFGLHPWGHHLTSVLLHALSSSLLLLALFRMTGALWRSALAAALFGLHPLHVESVAWIAERKDVLSGLFWMLTLLAYAAYARRAAERRPAWGAYALALALFALGLMSKPMVVTLPCVLLLLDYWPLGRFRAATMRAGLRIAAEKLPFLALSAVSCLITLRAQAGGDAVASAAEFPPGARAANALVAYCAYLGKCLYPHGLAVFYPSFAEPPPLRDALLAAAALGAVTILAAALARRAPYAAVGWLWFLGTLVPVIGLVQVGGQAMADRYSYLPLVGIFIWAAWALGDLAERHCRLRRPLACLCCAAVAGSAAAAEHQLSYWRDGETLFRHAAAVTKDNWVAHANLYATLKRRNDPGAGEELRQTMAILAAFAEKHVRRGEALEKEPGRSAEALEEYRTAVGIMPDLAGPHEALAAALARTRGGMPGAIAEFREAARLEPESGDAHYNLATALASTPGGRSEAITEYESATLMSPENFQAHFNLAYLLSSVPGRGGDAASEYGEAVRIRPGSVEARFNYGLALAALPGRSGEAVAQFEEVLRLRPGLAQAKAMISRLRGR
jgi:tetratricopeptide (TPR) repeat protein